MVQGLAGEAETFDPASVPPYPVVRLVMRHVPDSDVIEGLVDGQVVVEDGDVEVVRAQIIEAAASKAVARPGMRPAIRAVGEDLEGDAFHLVITGDGEVFERDDAGYGSKPASASKGKVIAAGLLLVGLLGGGIGTAAAIVMSSGGEQKSASAPVIAQPAAPSPTPTQVPVPVAPGWAEQAAWSVPVGSGAGSPGSAGAASDGKSVFAAADGSSPAVSAYDARTGQRRWRAAVDQPLTAGPFLTRVEDQTAVVAASSSRLYAWTPAGSEIGSWKLSASQKVTPTPTGPVVSAVGSQHAQIVVGGKLVTRVLPAASTAVAPSQGGVLIAAGGAGQVWSVASPEVAGAAVNLEAPGKSDFKAVVAATPKVMVVSYAPQGKSAGKVVLRAFALGSWKPVWTSGEVPDSSDAAMVAPGGAWGVFGSSVVDLGSGKTVGLPQDWRATSVGDEVGFGTTASQVRSVTVRGLGGAAPTGGQNTVTQQAPQAAAGSMAFLVASDGEGQHLYAVPLVSPSATAPVSSSSSKSSKSSSKPSASSKSSSSKPKGK